MASTKKMGVFFDYGPLQDPCEEVSVSASMLLKHRLQLKGEQGVRNDQKVHFVSGSFKGQYKLLLGGVATEPSKFC